MDNPTNIYLVDDDDAVRRTLSRALQHSGYPAIAYGSGAEFMQSFDTASFGCLILDVAMPGMSGLDVQSELNRLNCPIPIIFITGHGDIPTSVKAIKGGAIEFLQKPYPMDVLLERIEEALINEDRRYSDTQLNQKTLKRFASLTKREADVMASLVAGLADRSNKQVAKDLEISPRTVEEYRARILQKMKASSITHLVEIAKTCGIYRAENPSPQ